MRPVFSFDYSSLSVDQPSRDELKLRALDEGILRRRVNLVTKGEIVFLDEQFGKLLALLLFENVIELWNPIHAVLPTPVI